MNKYLPDVKTCEKYAWRNISSQASFHILALENPTDEGSYKVVSFGVFTAGRRKGQTAVGKLMKASKLCIVDDDDGGKDGVQGKAQYSAMVQEIQVANIALRIVAAFNLAQIFPLRRVLMTVPEVWDVSAEDRERWPVGKLMIEPFVPFFRKFNTNRDWCDDSTTDGRGMQALSHFSYHITEGRFILCDVQGGFDGDDIVLTDPAILSQDLNYGRTDRGIRGMKRFFSAHSCYEFCFNEWIRPRPSSFYSSRSRSYSSTASDLSASTSSSS